MRIQVSSTLPPIQELAEVLQHKFSSRYACKTFGLGKKNVMVSKSTLVGAEISVHENVVSISWSPPSVFAGILLAMGLTELIVLLIPFFFSEALSIESNYRTLEKEIATFLRFRYG